VVLRIALAIYLSLVTLAGPWFCCCIVLRLFAHLMPQAPIGQVSTATAASCCAHSHSTKVSSSRPPEKPSDKPFNSECPCHRHQERVAAVPPAHAEAQATMPSDLVFLGFVLTPDLAVEHALFGQHSTPFLGAWNLLPFLSAVDLRCALHIMRC
jgi:hypothetical protein